MTPAEEDAEHAANVLIELIYDHGTEGLRLLVDELLSDSYVSDAIKTIAVLGTH